MPSPFPGMDPYLEDPALWPDVHHRLISVASDLLTEQLRPKYLVRIEERVYISDEKDPGRRVISPDLHVVERIGSGTALQSPAAATGVEVAEPIVATTVIRDEIRESRLQIIDASTRAVVTVIEVLSPSNKVAGSRGRQNYEDKRDAIFDSPTHLVEIDLLRSGDRVLPPLPQAYDYVVHVSRSEKRPRGVLWPILLAQQLPPIPIPLHGVDENSTLDLQAVLSVAYDRAAYELEMDYSGEPVPVLTDQQRTWTNDLLTGKGLR